MNESDWEDITDTSSGNEWEDISTGAFVPATLGQAAEFTGKAGAQGAAKFLDLINNVNPSSIIRDLITSTVRGELPSFEYKTPIQDVTTQLVGSPKDVGLVGRPGFEAVPDLVQAAAEGGVIPFGGAAANALANVSAETAHKLFPESRIAPLIGALIPSAGAGAARLAAQKAAQEFPTIAGALERKSIGARASDYGKASDVRTVETPSGQMETRVKRNLDELLTEGKLGSSRDPATLLKTIDDQTQPLSEQVNQLINSYDEAVQAGQAAGAVPEFDNALNYLAKGKVPANEVDKYLNEIDDLNSAIRAEGQGKLSYLQKQKQAMGDKWDPADKVKSGFYRALYTDLKKSIEKYVPEVASLNEELSKYMTAKPIVTRSLKAQEAASPLEKLLKLTFTTGGISGGIVGGSALGGPVGATIGAALGLGGRALSTPRGMSVAASALRKAGSGASRLESLMGLFSAPGAASLYPALFSGANRMTEKESTTTDEEQQASNQSSNDDIADSLVNAVISQESGNNSRAVSKKGAQGLMQLMPATGREVFKKLGLEGEYDPFDKELNVKLGTAYLKQMLDEFDGDIELALTAYNSGPNRVKALLKKHQATTLDEIRPYLGPQGRAYAKSVLAKLSKATDNILT